MTNDVVWCGYRGLANDVKQCCSYHDIKNLEELEKYHECDLCIKGQIANELQDIAGSLRDLIKKY